MLYFFLVLYFSITIIKVSTVVVCPECTLCFLKNARLILYYTLLIRSFLHMGFLNVIKMLKISHTLFHLLTLYVCAIWHINNFKNPNQTKKTCNWKIPVIFTFGGFLETKVRKWSAVQYFDSNNRCAEPPMLCFRHWDAIVSDISSESHSVSDYQAVMITATTS